MHELVGSDHSMTHVVAGSCKGETRTSEHTGISPAEDGWIVANDNETYLVAALTRNVLQQCLCLEFERSTRVVPWLAMSRTGVGVDVFMWANQEHSSDESAEASRVTELTRHKTVPGAMEDWVIAVVSTSALVIHRHDAG
jgi:hypothetical protein